MKRIIIFLEFFISKRIHIGILAFLEVIFFMRCLGINTYHPLVPFISFFIVWAAYLENLTTDKKEDNLGQTPHGLFPFVESKLYSIEKFYPFLYLAAIVLSLLVSLKCLLYVVLTIIVFFSYVHKWVPIGKNKRKRLKEIFIIKNLIPPIGWVFSTGIIPFITSNSRFIPEYILLIIIVLLWSFREEVKFDIPDIEGDRKAGIKTLPNVLDEGRTKIILNNIQCISAILFFGTLIILRQNNRIPQFDYLLINLFPILTFFLYDYNFMNLLFERKKKEFCNIGIIWYDVLLFIYLTITYPFNVILFLFLRITGNLFAQTISGKIDYFLNVLGIYTKQQFLPVKTP